MRALLALGALTIAAAVAACTSIATGTDTGENAGAQPTVQAGTRPPSVVTATCTGRTSDAASLQQAINSSSPGAVIEIRGGICLLTRGIIFLDDRTYTGYNTTGTVLKQDGDMSYVLASQAYADNSSWTGEPVTIRDLTVECNGSGGTNGVVVLNWQADLEEIDVHGCGGSGIVDTNTTADGKAIKNTSVNSRFDNNFISNSGRYGFEIYDSGNSVTDGFLDDNLIGHSGLDGIHLDNAAGWDISGNHLYGNARNGIYADRLYGTTISNNYIENFGHKQGSGTWCGIAATVQGGIGSTIFNNKIFNDLGESAGAKYIYLCITRTNYGTGYLSVTGNVIVGNRSSDVGLAFDGGSNKLIVVSSGNEVAHVGTVKSDTRSATVTAGT
jgi:parallel beta-helix repeat protein